MLARTSSIDAAAPGRFTGVEVVDCCDSTATHDPPGTGLQPSAVATLTIGPAATSALVTTYSAVHVVDAPGANSVAAHTIGTPASASMRSLTTILVSVTVPVLVTANE